MSARTSPRSPSRNEQQVAPLTLSCLESALVDLGFEVRIISDLRLDGSLDWGCTIQTSAGHKRNYDELRNFPGHMSSP